MCKCCEEIEIWEEHIKREKIDNTVESKIFAKLSIYTWRKGEKKIKGNKEITLELKEEYKEPGYIATLSEKDITKDVKVTGKVDTTQIGDYTLTYSVTNTKGKNRALAKSGKRLRTCRGKNICTKGRGIRTWKM